MPSCVPKNYNKDGYCKSTNLGNDQTKDFHVYGAGWTHNRIKFYADGKLTRVLKKKTGKKKKQWPCNKKKDCKMYIWLDNEAFSWQGLPTKESLPADYEIDYVHVWKRQNCTIIVKSIYIYIYMYELLFIIFIIAGTIGIPYI
mmetsp:Transcript_31096/g.31631  ORF Transcript_31096/g.31631 Transcript_31096/m.31631 type:complete len:143 (+) Transcript_31096:346-774(+)